MVKKLALNTLQSLVLIAAGIVLWILLFKQWVPFNSSNNLGAVIDLMVPYVEVFLGATAIAYGISSNLVVRAAIRAWKW